MPISPINLAVLISGSGMTLQNLTDAIAARKLDARINLVIASRPEIAGVDRAKRAGLRTEIVDRRQFPDVVSFGRRIFELVQEVPVDLICLAGWLCLLDVPKTWEGRIMNIHPALLPDFGGRGMYGQRVHEAVLKNKSKTSGCTVHFVDRAYDTGPIILQRTCPVLDDDTPQLLAQRVFEEEKIAYPEAIRLFASGKLRMENRQVRIAD